MTNDETRTTNFRGSDLSVHAYPTTKYPIAADEEARRPRRRMSIGMSRRVGRCPEGSDEWD